VVHHVWHWNNRIILVILFIILLVFGSKKLPELAKGLGKGINEFKRASQDIQKELDVNSALDPEPTKNEPKAKAATEEPPNTQAREAKESTTKSE